MNMKKEITKIEITHYDHVTSQIFLNPDITMNQLAEAFLNMSISVGFMPSSIYNCMSEELDAFKERLDLSEDEYV